MERVNDLWITFVELNKFLKTQMQNIFFSIYEYSIISKLVFALKQ